MNHNLRKQEKCSYFKITLPLGIHRKQRRLVNVHGKPALDVNAVRRWINRINGNLRKKETDFTEKLYSGRPAATVNEDKVK